MSFNFFRSRKRVYVLDYLSFIQDREVLGVFSSLDKSIEGLRLFTQHKLWSEGDIFSIYEQEVDEVAYSGLTHPVLYVNIYGPTFNSNRTEKVYTKLVKECIPRTTKL